MGRLLSRVEKEVLRLQMLSPKTRSYMAWRNLFSSTQGKCDGLEAASTAFDEKTNRSA